MVSFSIRNLMYAKAFSVVGCFITYIAWVHMYTPGGSASELPLFVVHACSNRDIDG